MPVKPTKKKKETPYQKFCILFKYYPTELPKDFLKSLKDGHFTLQFDKASLTDISVSVEGLKILPCISSLSLEGKYSEPPSILRKPLTSNSQHRTQKKPEARPSHSLYHLSKLLEGLSINFTAKGNLLNLKIVGFYFDSKGWAMINQCLKVVTTLVELQISRCHLNDEELSIATNSIVLKDLGKVDISYNLLENDGCDIISRVISRVNSCQIEMNWSTGLRSSLPAPAIGGLKEVILSHNKISDKGLINLIHGLFYDDFVKVLDLSFNQLTSEAYKEVSYLLKTNSSLIIIDLQENQKTKNMNVISEIAQKLEENFQVNKWVINEEQWQEQVDKLQNMLLSQPSATQKIKNKELKDTGKKAIKRLGLGSEHRGLHEKDREKKTALCDKCEEFEVELFKSKSQCINLQIQNNLLQKKLDSSRPKKRN